MSKILSQGLQIQGLTFGVAGGHKHPQTNYYCVKYVALRSQTEQFHALGAQWVSTQNQKVSTWPWEFRGLNLFWSDFFFPSFEWGIVIVFIISQKSDNCLKDCVTTEVKSKLATEYRGLTALSTEGSATVDRNTHVGYITAHKVLTVYWGCNSATQQPGSEQDSMSQQTNVADQSGRKHVSLIVFPKRLLRLNFTFYRWTGLFFWFYYTENKQHFLYFP